MLLRWSCADQTLVIYSFVMSTERREKRGIMSGEKHFNMTKPAPGDPRFSSQIPDHEQIPFLLCWSPVLPFPLPPPPSPHLVHFSPLMQIALLLPSHIYDLLPPSVKYALKNRGGLNAASHIGLASINGQITSLLDWVKSKHSSMSIHEGALAFKRRVALGSIKMNRDWLMCKGVISTEADWMMLSRISSSVAAWNAQGTNVFMLSPLI